MSELKIRDAQLEDAQRLVEIYSHYVLNTAVSFECTAPSVEEFADRIKNIKTKFPYLVCEKDGKIIGYVYASSYSSRAANRLAPICFFDICFCHRAPSLF